MMARIRAARKPESRPCPCGGVMQPARRYEATRTLDVLICWRCGAEDPAMVCDYRAPSMYCRWCGARFTATDPRQRYCPDTDCADKAGRITLDRRFTGQQIRRRPA